MTAEGSTETAYRFALAARDQLDRAMVTGFDPASLETLGGLLAVEELLRLAVVGYVRVARGREPAASWETLGEVAGVTRGAAHARWADEVEREPPPLGSVWKVPGPEWPGLSRGEVELALRQDRVCRGLLATTDGDGQEPEESGPEMLGPEVSP